MKAKSLPEYITVNASAILPDGVRVLEVNCSGYQAYTNLPSAIEYHDKTYGLSGWNSDRYIAYYRDDVHLARVI